MSRSATVGIALLSSLGIILGIWLFCSPWVRKHVEPPRGPVEPLDARQAEEPPVEPEEILPPSILPPAEETPSAETVASEPPGPEPVPIKGKWLITGRVVKPLGDPEAGNFEPVEGAWVHFKPHPRRTRVEDAPPPQKLRTGPDGRFAFGGVPGNLWLRLEIDEPSFSYRTLSFELDVPDDKGRSELGDIILEPPQTVVVDVVGPEGEPVSGASVLVGRSKTDRSATLGAAEMLESRRDAVEVGKGRYKLERAPPSPVRIQVLAAGYSRFREYVEVPAEGPVVIRVERGLKIAGLVRSASGEPIPGADLEIDGPNVGAPPPRTTTGEKGSFAFDILSDGEYAIKVGAKGFVSMEAKNLTAGVEDVEFVLTPEAVFSGQVVADDDGKPVAGAKVVLQDATRQKRHEGETDAGGRFEIRGAGAGTYSVLVNHEDFAPLLGMEVQLAEGERVETLTWKLKRGLTLRGSVLDSATGRPVPRAWLSFRYRGRLDGTRILRSGEADADGKYELGGFADGPYVLTVKADEYLEGSFLLAVDASGAVSDEASGAAVQGAARGGSAYDVLLERGLSIAGRVVDPQGGPVPAVELRLAFAPAPPAAGAALQEPDLEASLRAQPAGRAAGEMRKVSGAEGSYRFSGLPAGVQCTLVATHKEFVRATLSGLKLEPGKPLEAVDVVLRRGGKIRGRVVDESGAGIAMAKVRAYFQREPTVDRSSGMPFRIEAPGADAVGFNDPAGSTLISFVRVGESVRTDGAGAFQVARLEAGTYTLRAEVPNRLPGEARGIVVAEDETTAGVDILSEPGQAVAGRVVDLEGKPIPGADLRFQDANSTHVTADLNGEFLAEGLPEGSVPVQVEKTGYLRLDAQVQAGDRNLVLKLEPPSAIRGTVVAADSRAPIARARISLMAVAQDPDRRPSSASSLESASVRSASLTSIARSSGATEAVSRPDGSFVLAGIASGPYSLVVQHPAYATTLLRYVHVETGETAEVSVEMGAGGSIRGLVTRAGVPEPGAWVFAAGSGENQWNRKNVRSGPDGRYELAGLAAGEYTVYARPGTGTGQTQMARVKARVAEGETLELDLDLQSAPPSPNGDLSPRLPSR